MKRKRRQRYFVDSRLQGALLWHAMGFWLWGSVIFTLIVLLYRVVPTWLLGRPGFGTIWYHLSPLAIASAALLPLAILGATRFSRRFVRPILQLRSTLRQLADGEAPAALEFLGGGVWSEIGRDVNRVALRIRRTEAKLQVPQPNSDEAADRETTPAVVS